MKFVRGNYILFRSGTNAELKLKLHKLFLWVPDNIIAVSKNARDDFFNNGFPCEVYYPAFCYESSIRDREVSEEKFLFYAGKISENKGVIELVKFCATNNLSLKLAGFPDKNDIGYFNKFLEIVDTSIYISYLGTLSELEVVNFIRKSCGYISNSKIEGFPIVFLYCLQFGIPIYTRRFYGFPEDLEMDFIKVFEDIFELSGVDFCSLNNESNSTIIQDYYNVKYSNDYKFNLFLTLCQKYYLS